MRAIATGNDLLTQLDQARISSERQLKQAEGICRALIDRHYGAWELPPPELRLHVGANDHAVNFWSKGIASSGLVLKVFGTDPGGPVLDWGCGSGRTLLWLQCHEAWTANYCGCDVDADAIAWLRTQGMERVETCGDLPPLPYGAGEFAGLFAFSVLTHIPPDRHRQWYEEIARLLRPGGRALVTTHGTWTTARVSEQTRDRIAASGAGYETCATPNHYKDASVVTEEFTREAVDGVLEVESYEARGYLNQDAWLLRR